MNGLRDKFIADLKKYQDECEEKCLTMQNEQNLERDKLMSDVEKFEASGIAMLKQQSDEDTFYESIPNWRKSKAFRMS